MSKYKFTIIWCLLFPVPMLGYSVVNFYWWLFDGNQPIANKMMWSVMLGLLTAILAMPIALVESEEL